MITNKNYVKYIGNECAVTLTNMFAFGAIVQTYLAYVGLDTGQIGVYTSLGSLMQGVGIFFSMWAVDKLKNIKSVFANCMYVMSMFFVCMICIGFFKKSVPGMLFPLAIVACVIYSVGYGFRSVMSYRLPYLVIDMKDYGKILGIIGVMGNVIGVLSGSTFSFLTGVFEYNDVIISCFIIMCIALILAANAIKTLEVNDTVATPDSSTKISKSIFKEKSLLHLAPVHFFRGISSGILGMTATLFITKITTSASLTSVLVVINSVACIISCSLYIWLSGKFRTTIFSVAGGLAMGISIAVLLTTANVYMFYVFFFLATVGLIFIDNAVPVFISEFVAQEHIGSYTSVRMFITMGGTAVGNLLTGILLTYDMSLSVVILIGIIPILGSIPFYIYDIFVVKRKILN